MKQIQPISCWLDGNIETANYIDLVIVYDDLELSASVIYELKYKYLDVDNVEYYKSISKGNITIDGTDYQNWGTTIDVNTDAYNIAAAKLNLTLI